MILMWRTLVAKRNRSLKRMVALTDSGHIYIAISGEYEWLYNPVLARRYRESALVLPSLVIFTTEPQPTL